MRVKSLKFSLLFLCLAAALSGCQIAGTPGFISLPVTASPAADGGFFSGERFLAAGPSETPVSRPREPKEEWAERTVNDSETPLWLRIPGYTVLGAPRDVVAAVVEPAGYGVGAVLGVTVYAFVGPIVSGYEQNTSVSYKTGRSITMGIASPFFGVSDLLCRSFTGDVHRWRWGHYPFPRADHAFFPNYHAFFDESNAPR